MNTSVRQEPHRDDDRMMAGLPPRNPLLRLALLVTVGRITNR